MFDPVHGTVPLPPGPLELVADPAFQRLWGIRQTGLAHLVFPGANHTRLEHSLGVFSVAGRIGEALDLPREESRLLAVGGLLHDLGHGPLSHTLDGPMREVLGIGHEERSRALVTGADRLESGGHSTPTRIPELLERQGLGTRAVADLIDPPSAGGRLARLRPLLHGAIDADRIDYLQRDAHYTGVGHGAIDASRLLDTIRWHAGRVVFAEKGRQAVEGFVVGRSLMYSAVYFHKTVRAAEVMAQAAVERLPGYPEAARPIFAENDGELFGALERAGGISAELERGLRERRLYKRVAAWRSVPEGSAGEVRRLVRRPEARRAREEEIARAVGAPEGAVLIDLSGSLDPSPGDADWSRLGILDGNRVTYPFREPGIWREIAHRPRNPWRAAVYAHPRHAAATARYLTRRSWLG